MLRDALRVIERGSAPTFVVWRHARRCYFNAAARVAFPDSLGLSGTAFARAEPLVREIVRAVEALPEPARALPLAIGEVACVALPLFNAEGGIDGTLVRAGGYETIPEIYRELSGDVSLLSQIANLLPVLVFTMRPGGERDFVNRAFLEYAGLALQTDDRHDVRGIVHADDRAAMPTPWDGAADDAKDLWQAELRVRRTDGLYLWHALRLQAIRSRGGAIVKWIGTLLDIHARRRAEAELAEVNANLDSRVDELERVLDVAPVGIAIANGFESDEIRLNRALMEMLGETDVYVPYGHGAFRYLRGVDLEQIAPSPAGVEVEIERGDGSSRHMAVSVVPLKKIDGSGGGVVAAFVDVSAPRARALRRETLLAAHRGLTLATSFKEMVRGIAHAFASTADACAVATPAGIVVDDQSMLEPERSAFLASRSERSPDGRAIVLSCRVHDRVVATIGLRREAERAPFDDDDFAAFSEFGDVAGIAIDRARLYEREHRATQHLAQMLLPGRLPQVDGLALSVAVRRGSDADAGGGSSGMWCDGFVLADGRVALSIGAIDGRDLDAVITLYAVRQSLREGAIAGLAPAKILAEMSAVIVTDPRGRPATACVAIVDRAAGVVRSACFGHPEPFVAYRDGTTGIARGGEFAIGDVRGFALHAGALSEAALAKRFSSVAAHASIVARSLLPEDAPDEEGGRDVVLLAGSFEEAANEGGARRSLGMAAS